MTRSSYDAIVVESAISVVRWLPAAVNLVKARADTLGGLPSAHFAA
jgi:menaquinone-dependent protoporphyrinogen IX oxidase